MSKDIWGSEREYKQARKTRGDAGSENNEMGDTPLIQGKENGWSANDKAQYGGVTNDDKTVYGDARELKEISADIGKAISSDGLLDSSGYQGPFWQPGPVSRGGPARREGGPRTTAPVDAYEPEGKYGKKGGAGQRSGR